MSLVSAADTLLSISERFRSKKTVGDLSTECMSVLSQFGAYHFAAGMFNTQRPAQQTLIATEYPRAWIEHYFSRRYIDIDPTVTTASLHQVAYDWDFSAARRSVARELFSDVYDLGVRRGLTAPIHGPAGDTFVASFAATSEEASPSEKVLLTWIAAQFHEHYVTTLAPRNRPAPDLTARERDCLTWVARGKSSWDIGAILGISENTVNFHLKNAFVKLDVKGRTMGVVKAITIGAIEP